MLNSNSKFALTFSVAFLGLSLLATATTSNAGLNEDIQDFANSIGDPLSVKVVSCDEKSRGLSICRVHHYDGQDQTGLGIVHVWEVTCQPETGCSGTPVESTTY